MKNVREHDDVRAEARRLQEVVHVMVEKNDQLPADDPRRKFKYRVVLLGNSLATFEASRWADLKDERSKLPMLPRLTSRLTLPCGWSRRKPLLPLSDQRRHYSAGYLPRVQHSQR